MPNGWMQLESSRSPFVNVSSKIYISVRFLKTSNSEIIHIPIFHERNVFYMKCIGDILAYMQLNLKKFTELKGGLLQYFIHLQHEYIQRGRSPVLFSQN